MEIKRVYLLTMDGEDENDYGAQIYLVGIFTEEVLAELARDQAIENNEGLTKDAFKITSVEVNNPYDVKPLYKDFYRGSWETLVDLGGYCE
jgi:hypothetical protein